ncbi:Uncharacterised protein [Vibrio cholerae]|uniref:Uncharacterized protein n=1 Tax=Vibrio cholerae TaxID=666 RepID=A0A655W188_VIBCL|nr:Uncharacterised protein [Vibrio cholerae]CSB79320.1 Uncharacterised protein [Vibrio cholerae]
MLSVCIHKIANSQTVASHPTRHFFKFLKELFSLEEKNTASIEQTCHCAQSSGKKLSKNSDR